MILKQVIRYTNADAIEATWVEQTQLPDVQIPAVLDEEGNVAEPARTEPGGIQEIVVKCQAYANSQMDMLAADLGADAPAYQALMDEVAATYVPPPPAPPYVPQSVTRRQAKQALLLAGLLSGVQPAIDAIPDPTQRALIQIEWDDSQVFERNRPALIALGGALGLNAAGLDALFIQAAAL